MLEEEEEKEEDRGRHGDRGDGARRREKGKSRRAHRLDAAFPTAVVERVTNERSNPNKRARAAS